MSLTSFATFFLLRSAESTPRLPRLAKASFSSQGTVYKSLEREAKV
jgi:hypothetical protein